MPGTHTGNKQTQARIFHLLLAEQSLTRQEIAETLHLSMPTALQNITELLQRGLLEECGVIQSTGGRKGLPFVWLRFISCQSRLKTSW